MTLVTANTRKAVAMMASGTVNVTDSTPLAKEAFRAGAAAAVAEVARAVVGVAEVDWDCSTEVRPRVLMVKTQRTSSDRNRPWRLYPEGNACRLRRGILPPRVRMGMEVVVIKGLPAVGC